jgi:hypothetical protein
MKGKRQCKRLKSVVMDMFFSWSGLFERMLRRGLQVRLLITTSWL